MSSIGFTVVAQEKYGSGDGAEIEYDDQGSVITNVGGGFDEQGKQVFRSPEAGLYFFEVSFVREAFGRNSPSNDDVYVYITMNSHKKVHAWAGESAAPGGQFRETGTVSVVLPLNLGDVVGTWIIADAEGPYCAQNIVFSGFKVS